MSPAAYLPLLVATIAVELALAAVLVRGPKRRSVLAALTCANLVTHPLATLATLHVDAFAAVEVLVAGAEAAALAAVTRLRTRHAVAVAVVANLATVALSMLWWR